MQPVAPAAICSVSSEDSALHVVHRARLKCAACACGSLDGHRNKNSNRHAKFKAFVMKILLHFQFPGNGSQCTAGDVEADVDAMLTVLYSHGWRETQHLCNEAPSWVVNVLQPHTLSNSCLPAQSS